MMNEKNMTYEAADKYEAFIALVLKRLKEKCLEKGWEEKRMFRVSLSATLNSLSTPYLSDEDWKFLTEEAWKREYHIVRERSEICFFSVKSVLNSYRISLFDGLGYNGNAPVEEGNAE